MSTQHTEGEWYSKREGYSTVYVFCRIGGGLVQEVAAIGPQEGGIQQQDANARLIVAAPDLLKMLIQLADYANGFSVSGVYLNEEIEGDRLLKNAYVAIAKATGEAQ